MPMNRMLLGALVSGLMLVTGPARADPATDAAFKAIYTREWTWRTAQFPDGEDEGAVDASFPDVSSAAQVARLKYWQDVLRQLDALPVKQLSPDAAVDYGIYRYQIVTMIAAQQFRDYEKPLNSDSSFWGDLTYAANRPLRDAGQYRNYIAWMNAMPRYFAQNEANMRAGLARGFTPPRVTLAGRDAGVATVAEVKAPQDSIFYKPFKDMPKGIPAGEQAALRAAAVKAIDTAVTPAHAELLKFLRDDYIPHARTALAAESLPDGKAYYASKIYEYTTLNLTPDQIHQIGLQQVAMIRAQMLEVMAETGFKGDLPAFLEYLRTDRQFYTADPQDLLNRAAWIAKQFDGKASTYFGHNPRGRFTIRPVPPEIAPYYTAGRGGTGVYLLNTYDLPSRSLYQLRALTLHESAPGHSWQGALALENHDRPDFRRKTYISAYGEGWALYCEKLGVEMGMYETPYDRFGMLSYQMWRAARLVVDTGIHAKGWTREQALAFLHDNTALSNHEIETETDRYIGWPGQALAYYLGEMSIEKSRAKAEAALGPKFNIRAFHDLVLAQGSVPLPVLEAQVDGFIAGGGVGPYPDEEK
jgi:uncharacterized protein (DUF885 family)